jgi:hypothetical protein
MSLVRIKMFCKGYFMLNRWYREMRRLFHFIDSKVTPKFPEAKKIRYTAVGGFIFLRFFVPAIMVRLCISYMRLIAR